MFYANSTTLNCPGTNPSWYLFNSTANSTTPISVGGKYSIASNGSLIIKDLSKLTKTRRYLENKIFK